MNWEVVGITLVVFNAALLGGFWGGRTSQRISTNESHIRTIFKRIDVIHEFVKNGVQKP